MTTSPTWTAEMLERVLADAAAIAPDAEVLDRAGWLQVTTPSRIECNRNGVFISRLEPAEADHRIAEITRYYRERNTGFRWIVGPSSSPDDLSDRLTRAGIPVFGTALGMHMTVPTQVPEPPASLEFRELESHDIETYVDLTVRGWQHQSRTRAETERITQLMFIESNRHRAWVVYEHGEPVGTTLLCLFPGVGYLQGAAVLPEHRRHGIYLAMLHFRFALLRRLGIEHAVIWASEATSAGQCRRVGFVPLCRAVFHELPQPQ